MANPSKKYIPREKSVAIYRRLLGYLKPHRRRFAVAFFMLLIFGATDGAIPYILKHILDGVFGRQDKSLLWLLVGVIMIFALTRAVCGFFQSFLTETVGLRIVEDIRNEISRKLLELSQSFYIKQTTGSLISRVTNDSLLVQKAITDASVSLLRDSARIIALLTAAVYLDPTLALISFVGIPLGVIPVIKFGKRVRQHSHSGQVQLGGLTAILHEIIVGNPIIQAFRMEHREARRFSEVNRCTTRSLEKAVKYGALAAPVNEILGSAAIAMVIMYGGLSVISGVRTEGDFIAFITALFLLYEPVKKLGRLNNTIQTGVAAADRIFEIIDLEPEIKDKPGAVKLCENTLNISYKNVCFRYPENETSEDRFWTLKDINFDLSSGKSLALVGMSGGGKSTLVKLLPRFYDPQKGHIEINGRDISNYTLDSLRASISVVSQNTFLFNDTIFNNIAYGRLGASSEDIYNAARAAHAHEFVSKLPEGYDTTIGDQGFRLSGGERARVAIARALLKDSPILVLDEATANLDSESEKLVQTAIERLMSGRTVLVIAHRLSTILNADEILVISSGEVVERGSHQELLKRGGEYAKLYALQFSDKAQKKAAVAL